MRVFYVVLIVVFVAFVGCTKTGNPSIEVQLPSIDKLSLKAQSLLSSSWPKMKVALPGLNKYGSAVKALEVKDSLNIESHEYRKLTIELVISEGKSDVPSDYKALGHHCFLDIDPAGKSVSIAKRPCKAVFLDHNIYGTENDNGDELVVSLN
jgi:hypothetical protein